MIGITVSVGYAEELAQTLPVWLESMLHIVVITDTKDKETERVGNFFSNRVECLKTDSFYENGATFNKGKALDGAYRALLSTLPVKSWVCIFDADILPPKDWFEQLPPLEIGNLYGAKRWQNGEVLIPDPPYEMPGYFWIFHTDDPHLPKNPTFTSWKHAGNYDTVFKDNWPAAHRIKLDLKLNHIGQPGKNWWGKGNEHKMQEMYRERLAKRGYQHERV